MPTLNVAMSIKNWDQITVSLILARTIGDRPRLIIDWTRKRGLSPIILQLFNYSIIQLFSPGTAIIKEETKYPSLASLIPSGQNNKKEKLLFDFQVHRTLDHRR